MITSLLIICAIFLIIKLKKIKISIDERIVVFFIVLTIPLMYLQILIMTDALYEVNVSSGFEATNLNLEIRDGYIGEKLEDKYIIYQQDNDLEIPLDNLMLNKNSYEYSFEELTIIYNVEIKFKNKFKEWLCKDFLMYKPILNSNKKLKIEENKEKIYNLYINNDLKIKGEN